MLRCPVRAPGTYSESPFSRQTLDNTGLSRTQTIDSSSTGRERDEISKRHKPLIYKSDQSKSPNPLTLSYRPAQYSVSPAPPARGGRHHCDLDDVPLRNSAGLSAFGVNPSGIGACGPTDTPPSLRDRRHESLGAAGPTPLRAMQRASRTAPKGQGHLHRRRARAPSRARTEPRRPPRGGTGTCTLGPQDKRSCAR